MTDVMLNLKFLSRTYNGYITSISAILFNRSLYSNNIVDKLYIKTTIDENSTRYFNVDEENKNWIKSNKNVKRWFLNKDRIDLKDALIRLSDFIPKDAKIWTRYDMIDTTVLGKAYTIYNMNVPWNIVNLRDLNTLMDICFVREEELDYLLEKPINTLTICEYYVKLFNYCLQKNTRNK